MGTVVDDRIAELAHELKTPLTGVLGAIDLVVDSSIALEPAEVAELLTAARSEANQLRGIIDGILQRTRLEAGTLAVTTEPVAMADVVEEALHRFPLVSDRTAFTGDLSLVASTDRGLLGQIMTNLVQNVDRYAPKGAVSISLTRARDQIRLVLSDSGPGLPGHDLPSSAGLGVGLTTSRRLAEVVGGLLRSIPPPSGIGATFELILPASDGRPPHARTELTATVPPRARLLQEVADLLVGTSTERILSGVGRLGREMLGATSTEVFECGAENLLRLGADGESRPYPLDDVARSVFAMANGEVMELAPDTSEWLELPAGGRAMATAMHSGEGRQAMLVVTWAPTRIPNFAPDVLPALGALALVAVDRRSMGAQLAFERRVRAEVMDSLPIAISVFVGDPPRVIGWNRAEREMLGLSEDDVRPEALSATQGLFDVRFEDGTPLTEHNAPVVETIRTGRSAGPFHLRVSRTDGTEIVTRTYCAPVRDDTGKVIGAVVTSEPVEQH